MPHHGVWAGFFFGFFPSCGNQGECGNQGPLVHSCIISAKTVTHLPVQFIRSQWEEGGQQTAAAELDVSIPVPSTTFVGDRFHWKIGLEGSCVMTVLLDFNFDFDFDFA